MFKSVSFTEGVFEFVDVVANAGFEGEDFTLEGGFGLHELHDLLGKMTVLLKLLLEVGVQFQYLIFVLYEHLSFLPCLVVLHAVDVDLELRG